MRREIKERAKEQLGRNIFGSVWMMGLLVCFLISVIVGAAGSILPGIGAIILTGPLTYGGALVFYKLATGKSTDIKVEDIFKGFSEQFGSLFLIGFMTQIFIFLWSLLFIIPGIVKSYSYAMVYYIKVEHSEYDWNQCIKESMRIMCGHKWDLFVLDLSFIGWFIVGSLCLGIGTLWVAPYYANSRANFYAKITEGPEVVNA